VRDIFLGVMRWASRRGEGPESNDVWASLPTSVCPNLATSGSLWEPHIERGIRASCALNGRGRGKNVSVVFIERAGSRLEGCLQLGTKGFGPECLEFPSPTAMRENGEPTKIPACHSIGLRTQAANSRDDAD